MKKLYRIFEDGNVTGLYEWNGQILDNGAKIGTWITDEEDVNSVTLEECLDYIRLHYNEL